MNVKLLLINNHNLFEMFAKCKNYNGKVFKPMIILDLKPQ